MKVARDRRNSRWDAHRQARRAELVDAAIRAVRRHGPGVGMDDVATEAGTSKTVVYRHFADRADLYLAVCGRVAEVLVTQIRAAMDGAAGARATTAAGIDAYLRIVEADPEVYRFVVHRPVLDRPLDGRVAIDPVGDLVSLLGDHAAAVIAGRLERTGADRTAAAPWGHGVVGMVHAAADHWLASGGRDGSTGMTRDAVAAHLTQLAWTGLSGVVASPPEQEDR
jgi:AcrR family transcriptional regulator